LFKAAAPPPRGAVSMQPQALARGVRPPAGPRAARGLRESGAAARPRRLLSAANWHHGDMTAS